MRRNWQNREAGVGKPGACRLHWGSLRLGELKAILILKFRHQHLLQAV